MIKFMLAMAAALFLLASPALAGSGGHMGNGGGTTVISKSGASSVANNVNHQTTSFNEKYQAPGVGGGGLTSTGVRCPSGSIYGGLSGPGFGVVFGTTTGVQHCQDLFDIDEAKLGAKVKRAYVLMNNPRVNAAYKQAMGQ